MDIFNEGKLLLQDIFYTDIRRAPTFHYVKSVFHDKWYNLLEPLVPPDKIDWFSIYKIIDEEKRNGVDISYYVPHDLFAAYKPLLIQKGYSYDADDVYVRKTLSGGETLPNGDFREVSAAEEAQYYGLAGACFPGYNSGEYCRLWVNVGSLLKKDSSDRQNVNILLYKDGKPVSFGSILYSTKLKLGYIHNTGTLETERRKGYFSLTIAYLNHIAHKEGIEAVYANVERDGGSYHGFLKLGFTENCRYHMFST